MAYDEYLGERINRQLKKLGASFYEKKMFGGLCFMVNEKICVGIVKETLMVRIDPEEEAHLKEIEGVQDMTFTGRPMKGYLYVTPKAIDKEDELKFYLEKALDFNPKAKMSRKRVKK